MKNKESKIMKSLISIVLIFFQISVGRNPYNLYFESRKEQKKRKHIHMEIKIKRLKIKNKKVLLPVFFFYFYCLLNFCTLRALRFIFSR